MTTLRGVRAAQFNTLESMREAIFNLSDTLILAKENGNLDEETFDNINERHIEPFMKVFRTASMSQGKLEQHKIEANKYSNLARNFDSNVMGGDGLERNRALFSLLIGELVTIYPKDVNIRALHTNLMSEKPGTHQPTYQIAELAPLVNYAISRGAMQLCRDHQNESLRRVEVEQHKIAQHMAQFNRHFSAMKTEVTREVVAGKERRKAALLAESNLVIQEQIRDVKTFFEKLIAVDGYDVKQLIQYSHLSRGTKLALNEKLNEFGEALKNQNLDDARAAARVILTTTRNIHGMGDYLLLRGLRGNFDYFHEVLDQKRKLDAGQMTPEDVLSKNVAEKMSNLKYNVVASQQFFEQYAAENKNSKFSSYTANKGLLAEKCGALMKNIKEKIETGQYQTRNDVGHDIRKLDALREEYVKVLAAGRESAIIFKPKGTGKFATHMNEQMLALKKDLEGVQEALQHTNKFKR